MDRKRQEAVDAAKKASEKLDLLRTERNALRVDKRALAKSVTAKDIEISRLNSQVQTMKNNPGVKSSVPNYVLVSATKSVKDSMDALSVATASLLSHVRG